MTGANTFTGGTTINNGAVIANALSRGGTLAFGYTPTAGDSFTILLNDGNADAIDTALDLFSYNGSTIANGVGATLFSSLEGCTLAPDLDPNPDADG